VPLTGLHVLYSLCTVQSLVQSLCVSQSWPGQPAQCFCKLGMCIASQWPVLVGCLRTPRRVDRECNSQLLWTTIYVASTLCCHAAGLHPQPHHPGIEDDPEEEPGANGADVEFSEGAEEYSDDRDDGEMELEADEALGVQQQEEEEYNVTEL